MLSPVLTLEVCLEPGSSCGVQGVMWTAGSCAPPPLLLLARCSCPPPGNTQERLCSLSSMATSWLQPRLASWVPSSCLVFSWLQLLDPCTDLRLASWVSCSCWVSSWLQLLDPCMDLRLASWVSSSCWLSSWLARLRSREPRLCRVWSWCSCWRITESRHGHRLPCCLTCTTTIAHSRAEASYISMLMRHEPVSPCAGYCWSPQWFAPSCGPTSPRRWAACWAAPGPAGRWAAGRPARRPGCSAGCRECWETCCTWCLGGGHLRSDPIDIWFYSLL